MNKKIINAIIVSLILVSAVLFNIFRHDIVLYQALILKAIPTLGMALIVLVSKPDKSNIFIAFGFVFSMLGDIFMEMPGEEYFLLGIATNTLGIVMYVLQFYRNENKIDWVRLIPVSIVMFVFYIILYDYLAGLKIHVMIYCLIHTIFIWRSSARLGKAEFSEKSQWICFIGSVSVTISDFLLSLTIFGIIKNQPKYEAIDMILWWSGLFMIMIATKIDKKVKMSIVK
ncbi:hypothetical protein VCSRO70_3456 [Vibrio cholerae]|nr:hypothetical protein VCSRO70_3456 [Vibrio cholerae]